MEHFAGILDGILVELGTDGQPGPIVIDRKRVDLRPETQEQHCCPLRERAANNFQ